MRSFRANISLDSDRNNVILHNVEIWVEETSDPRSGLKSWRGTFDLEHGQWLEIGERYFIELEDERSGEILLTRISHGVSHLTPMSFVGSRELG